jgi:hypothetical protein
VTNWLRKVKDRYRKHHKAADILVRIQDSFEEFEKGPK